MMAGAFKSFEVQVYQGTDKREKKKEKRLVIYLSVTLFSLLPMALNAPTPHTPPRQRNGLCLGSVRLFRWNNGV